MCACIYINCWFRGHLAQSCCQCGNMAGRSAIDAAEQAKLLEPFCGKKGFDYGDHPDFHVNAAKLRRQGAVLRALRGAQPNLSLKKTVVVAALRGVAGQRDNFGLSECNCKL